MAQNIYNMYIHFHKLQSVPLLHNLIKLSHITFSLSPLLQLMSTAPLISSRLSCTYVADCIFTNFHRSRLIMQV